MSTLLSTHGLSIGYRKHSPLCQDINLDVEAGSVVALLGGNGVGKSTLLRTLSGEMPALAGEVELCGRNLSEMRRRELARMLSIVATEATMTGALTVRQLVELGRQPYTGWSGVLTRTDRDVADAAIRSIGIADKADARVATLSDGERQKTMIARALAQDTPVMMLDEPLSFLDPAARIEVFALLRAKVGGCGKSVILSCHDVAMSLRMASALWLFTPDRRLITTTPEEAVSSGAISKLFSSPSVTFSPTLGDFISL